MRIIIVENYNEMSIKAAEFVINQIHSKPDSVLGLAAGKTPLGMYRELLKAYDKGEVNFAKATFFSLDEYCNLPVDNHQSFNFFINANFISRVNVKPENTFIPNGMTRDIEEECRNYDRKIMEKGGIDLQVLGIGQNGHIGFNEPGSNIESGTHLVQLNQSTIDANASHFNSREAVPTTAISMGIKTIMESKKIVLLASSEKKAEAIAKAIKGFISLDNPASILQTHPNVVFIIDEKAASLL